MNHIVAVLVTYNPDLKVLAPLMSACAAQVDDLVIVDNSETDGLAKWFAEQAATKAALIVQGNNTGIAAAQNAGIDRAREKGATHILLMDQDSTPVPDLAKQLQQALAELECGGKKVAAIGARYIDKRWENNNASSPFTRYENGRAKPCFPSADSPYVKVDFLIASGSLIPMQALNDVGGMNEQLFIDYVDVEWCLRAQRAGWMLYGVWDVVMEHCLGDNRITVGGVSMLARNPIRYYYTIRNGVWLCLQPYLLWRWRTAIALQTLGRLCAYSLALPPLKGLPLMCKAVSHGLSSKLGK